MNLPELTQLLQELNWLEDSWVQAFVDEEEEYTLHSIWKRIREIREMLGNLNN